MVCYYFLCEDVHIVSSFTTPVLISVFPNASAQLMIDYSHSHVDYMVYFLTHLLDRSKRNLLKEYELYCAAPLIYD